MTVRYDEKMVITGIAFAMSLVSSVDAFWLVSYQTGERYQYAGGGMFFDEMGENIWI